jgi:hypothetical protein
MTGPGSVNLSNSTTNAKSGKNTISVIEAIITSNILFDFPPIVYGATLDCPNSTDNSASNITAPHKCRFSGAQARLMALG